MLVCDERYGWSLGLPQQGSARNESTEGDGR